MQTDMQTDKVTYNDEDFLDLGEIAVDYLRCVKKYWLLFLILIVFVTDVFVIYTKWRYEPSFQAKVTYAVTKIDDSNVDAFTAKSLSGAVTTIAAMPGFKKDLLEETGVEGSLNYRLTSQYTTGANLFTISVLSNDYNVANCVLSAMEKVYPVWASKSNGTVELQVMDRTTASHTPTNPYSAAKSLIQGVIVGGMICFVFATWYVLTVKTVRKESDMKKITGKNCISLVPNVKVKKRSKNAKNTKERLLITNNRIDWGFQQALLAAQSRIEKQMLQKEQKVLLVTSTLPQEGKSIVTVNLALAFAKHDKKVVIIDGDLRNPSVVSALGCEAAKAGLIEYFDEDVALGDIIAVNKGISVIDAGDKRSEVSGLITESRMLELMEHLRSEYDFIFIDTPPSHLFTDAALLEKYADSVVYVVRNDMASVKEVKDGIAPFIRSDKLLGYIINRNQGDFSVYGKYGYTKYGHYGKYKRYIHLDESSMNTEDTL